MESRLLYSNNNRESINLSFIVPTYRRSGLLMAAIQSILKQKRLSELNAEIVVVNNDPNDEMIDAIDACKDSKIPISFYSNIENYGQVGNINQGVLLSRGKYVAILHDDDMLSCNYLESLMPFLLGRRKFDCIVVSQYLLYEKYKRDYKHFLLHLLFAFRFLYRKKLTLIKPSYGIKAFRDVYNPPSCGVLFNRGTLINFGLFKDINGAAWDFANFRNFNKKYDVYLLHEYVGIRRVETGMSNNVRIKEDFKRDELSMVEQNKNSLFVKLFGPCLAAKDGGLKYFIGRFLAGCFYYFHNLDSLKSAPKKYYEQ